MAAAPVRLPHEFRFEGDEVRIRKVAGGVLLEPLIPDTNDWFSRLDALNSKPFMKQGRKQPRPQRRGRSSSASFAGSSP
jgi:antitoxin VapB